VRHDFRLGEAEAPVRQDMKKLTCDLSPHEGHQLFGCVSLIGRALQGGNCRQSSSGPNDDDLIDILTLFELIFPDAFV
jgi:hypothetical protein